MDRSDFANIRVVIPNRIDQTRRGKWGLRHDVKIYADDRLLLIAGYELNSHIGDRHPELTLTFRDFVIEEESQPENNASKT